MRLERIIITNLGIYSGENIIDFTSNNENNLTLIIGKNGAGKTTLLNSIKTAFYGSMIYKVKSINEDYQNYLISLLNNNAKKNSNSSYCVELDFISNILGSDGRYTITREWQYTEQKLTETLIVKKNSRVLNEDDRNDFLNIFYQYYPIELFDLFFFDGEKIDQLSILNYDIIEVLETAFNLNHYKNLKSDLEKYALTKIKNSDLKLLEKEKNEISSKIPVLENKITDILHQITVCKNEINSQETIKIELAKIGFNNLEQFDDSEVKTVQKELDDLNKLYRQTVADKILFLAVKPELNDLTIQLKSESNFTKSNMIKSEIKKIKPDDLKVYLKNYDDNMISQVLNALIDKFESKTQITKIHDVSNEAYNQILKFTKEINSFSYENFELLKNNIESKRQHLDRIKKITTEKQTAEYKMHLDELLAVQTNLSNLNIKYTQLESELSILSNELDELKSKKEDIVNHIWKVLKTTNVDQLLIKTNKVLDEYIHKIKTTKLNTIKNDTLTMFNSIIRKENFISEIILTEHGICFLDFESNELSHLQISAGERQIFTLCLLISILKTTKRVTPLVFDTLLGRLDQNHRQNLLNTLLDSTSGQVIILATDSEIDHDTLNSLSNRINKTIEIDYYKK